MKRRLIAVFVLTLALVAVPGVTAHADSHCAEVTGTAMNHWGANEGMANLSVDGERQRVPFSAVYFEDLGDGQALIVFVFEFDQGDVFVIEWSSTTPKGGPAVAFDSEIWTEPVEGGSLNMDGSWAGTSNGNPGRAAITGIEMAICWS